MPNYGDADYWNERYSKNEQKTFDWLQSWSELKQVIERYAIDGIYEVSQNEAIPMPKGNYVLMGKDKVAPNFQAAKQDIQMKVKQNLQVMNLGCGNSIISEEMYDEGYLNISNMDISQVCIDQMKLRNKTKRPKMMWEVMDVTDLKYKDNQFDLIIDKSTIDAILCGTSAYVNVAKMLKECQRVLKEGGYYVAISYGAPDNRNLHFTRKFLHCKLDIVMIQKGTDKSSFHYIYILQKLPGADQVCNSQFDQIVFNIKSEEEEADKEADKDSTKAEEEPKKKNEN